MADQIHHDGVTDVPIDPRTGLPTGSPAAPAAPGQTGGGAGGGGSSQPGSPGRPGQPGAPAAAPPVPESGNVPTSPATPTATPTGTMDFRKIVAKPTEAEQAPDINVYDVDGRQLSIFDLLRRFAEGDFQAGGLSRLADLHLKVGVAARYRHDGRLVPLKGARPLTPEVMQGLMYPLLTPTQIQKLEREVPEDVDAGFHFEDEQLDFRLNVFHDRDGLAAVIRALPRQVPDTAALGFPDPAVVEDILNLRQGLVVVTGVTGSGKSTTIASILTELNARARMRVITLEDPVEYVLRTDGCLVSQREIGKNCVSFARGLRSALREDPDIIFLGEIRDTETANLALTAAETGHLVFTTLHTRDAKGVITRIVDLFPPERGREVMSQLSFSMSYVIAQKLLPRADRKGRVAAFEVLKNTSSIKNLIRTGNWHQVYATMQLSAKERMVTMERHLAWLAKKGLITQETALRYANDPSQLSNDGAGGGGTMSGPPQPAAQQNPNASRPGPVARQPQVKARKPNPS